MIIYHPRNDIYHCVFRFIQIANMQDLQEFEFTRLRIYDLFFLFPHLIDEVKFPRAKGVVAIKKQAICIPAPYESLPDKKRLFSGMSDYHIQAIQILLANRIFEETDGKLRLSTGFYSTSVANLLDKNQSDKSDFFCKLFNIFNQIDLAGESGLKQRTGLMEYRYDAV